MVQKSDSRGCLVTRQWEWGVTGYTPISTSTQNVQKSVTKYTSWVYRGMYGEWVSTGSWDSPSGGSNYSGSYPPTPSFTANDGDTTTTSGSGTAWFTEEVQTGGDPIYGWVGYSPSHNHPTSVSYDDGTYAGTLNFSTCNASAPAPSGGGTSGEQTTTSGSGTASYSGEVQLKPKVRPLNYSWETVKESGKTFNLTAKEWNDLLTRINEFRVYKGFTEITTFISAIKDADFLAEQFNQAVNIINTLSPPTSPPTTKSAGNTVLASYLNDLKDSLNSIA